jgi:tRNA threonylcarbamoyl adenosine modification protein YeaZ
VTISLAIDTATSQTSVALVSDGKVLWHGSQIGATDHGSVLPQLVQTALGVCADIDQVVVGMGPGPFTGLRVGISFAQAFAWARNIPLIGISSHDAIAHGIEINEFIVATDARRKEVYWAIYKNGERISDLAVSKPAELASGLPFFGEGSHLYQLAQSQDFLYPDPVALAALSSNQKLHVSAPLYLRRPDALSISERSS